METGSKRKIFFIGVIASILLAGAFISILLLSSKNEGYSSGSWYIAVSYTVFVAVIFWFFGIIYRIQAKLQRRIVWFIFLLCVAWIIIRTAKIMYPGFGRGSRYLWYMYYAPLVFLPYAFFLICNEMFHSKNKLVNLPVYISLALIGVALVVLILTNDLHTAVFSFPKGINYGSLNYDKRLGFYFIVLYAMSLIFASILELLLGTLKRNSKLMSVPPFIVYGAMIVYIVLYIVLFDKMESIPFVSDISFMGTIASVILLEVCLDVGLVQNGGRYTKYFHDCNVPMCIMDGEDVLFRSHTFDALKEEEGQNTNFEQMSVGDYTVVVQNDVSKLINMQTEIEKNSALLERSTSLKSERQSTKSRMELYDEIERITCQMVENVKQRTLALPDKVTKANKAKTMQDLAQINLDVAYLKHRGTVLAFAQDELSRIDFEKGVSAFFDDIKSIGFENVKYSYNCSDKIDYRYALACIETIYYVVCNFMNKDADVAFEVLPAQDRISVQARCSDTPNECGNCNVDMFGYSIDTVCENGIYVICVNRESN